MSRSIRYPEADYAYRLIAHALTEDDVDRQAIAVLLQLLGVEVFSRIESWKASHDLLRQIRERPN